MERICSIGDCRRIFSYLLDIRWRKISTKKELSSQPIKWTRHIAMRLYHPIDLYWPWYKCNYQSPRMIPVTLGIVHGFRTIILISSSLCLILITVWVYTGSSNPHHMWRSSKINIAAKKDNEKYKKLWTSFRVSSMEGIGDKMFSEKFQIPTSLGFRRAVR